MYGRSLLTIVVLALCAMFALASPVPPATAAIQVTEPHHNELYHVGDYVHVKVKLPGGAWNLLFKENAKIEFILQKDIVMPDLNANLGWIRARKLANDGFKFKVDKKFLIKEQATVPLRVRAHYSVPNHFGYSDSASFRLTK